MKLGDLIEVSKAGYNINISFRIDETGDYRSFFHDKSDVLMICGEFKRDIDYMFALLTKFGVMYATQRYIKCYTQKIK